MATDTTALRTACYLEYFAAVGLLEQDAAWVKTLVKHMWCESGWEEIIRFAASMTTEPGRLLDQMAEDTGSGAAARPLDDLFANKAQTGYADYAVASEDYFEALRIPVLRGRSYTDADGPIAPRVAVISEAVARQKWPGQDPIGQTIEFGNMDGDLRLLTIIGVVAEVRKHSLKSAPRPTIYVNYRQRPRARRVSLTSYYGRMLIRPRPQLLCGKS